MKKIALLLLKAVPVVGALCCAANSLLSYFYIDTAWTGFVMYAVFMTGWLALAYCFKFCSFYFKLIFYILTVQAINAIDYLYGLPLTNKGMFVLHCSIIGFLIIYFTICHVRDTRKLKEHLKETG